MDKVILKFPLAITTINKIMLPLNAQILSVQEHHGIPTMWALCDPKEECVIRRFKHIETGEKIEEANIGNQYIATVQLSNREADEVHIFELLQYVK